MKGILESAKQWYLNLKEGVESRPSSLNIYNLSWFLVVILISSHWYYGLELGISPISALVVLVFSIGFMIQLLEDSKKPSSIVYRIARAKLKVGSSLAYKAFLLFITTIFTAFAYSVAQQVVAETMSMPPKLFFNSVALATPFIWLFIVLVLALVIVCISMMVSMVILFLKSVIEQTKFMLEPLWDMVRGIGLILDGKEEKAQKLADKPIFREIDMPRMSPFIGALCVFFILAYAQAAYQKLLFSEEYIQLRKSIIVSLDFFEKHYCEKIVGEQVLISYVNDEKVVTARRVNGSWVTKSESCSNHVK